MAYWWYSWRISSTWSEATLSSRATAFATRSACSSGIFLRMLALSAGPIAIRKMAAFWIPLSLGGASSVSDMLLMY